MIAYYYPPINSGGSIRPVKMAKYLRSCGHNVWVLTHSYSRVPVDEEQTIRVLDVSFNRQRQGIKKVIWFCLRILGEVLNRLGIYHSIYTWWKKKVIARGDSIIERCNPHLIIVTYPPVETLEIGLHFSGTYSLPLISDFRDGLLFESIESKQMERHPIVYKRYSALEEKIARKSSAIITINKAIGDYFTNTYPGLRVEIVANGFDEEDFTGIVSFPGLQKNRFNLVHAGRFGLSDSSIQVEPFFRAIETLCQEQPGLADRFAVHLAGELSASEKKTILPLVKQGVVVYYGLLSREESLALQQGADLLLIITHPQRSSAVSAKIFEYLYTRKPILALTGETAVADIIKETGTGFIVHPYDESAIGKILQKCLVQTDPGQLIQPREDAICQFGMERQMARLGQTIRDLNGANGD